MTGYPAHDSSIYDREGASSIEDLPGGIGVTTDFLFEGGAEAVIETVCQSFAQSTLYTAIYDPRTLHRYRALTAALDAGRVRSSAAQWVANSGFLVRRLSLYHFYWLYFLTSAFQKTEKHALVIVSCCAQSKLIRIPAGTPTIVYFHTPTRWLYPQLVTQGDIRAIPWHLRGLMRVLNLALRPLDRLGMRRLRARSPVYLCNSTYIRDKLQEIYKITARVVYPPVDTQSFHNITRAAEDFFLFHGRVTFQKRVDLAIRGCLQARRKLVVSGDIVSKDLQRSLQGIVTQAVASDPSLDGLIHFTGRTSDAELKSLLAGAAAMIFPPREDFGIAPIEAISAGVPVIAYRAGGALDYIKPGVNGLFFEAQTASAVADVVSDFSQDMFDPETVAQSLPDLSVERFQREIREIAQECLRKAQL